VVQVFLAEFWLVLFVPEATATASTEVTVRGIEPGLFYVVFDLSEIAWVIRYLFSAICSVLWAAANVV